MDDALLTFRDFVIRQHRPADPPPSGQTLNSTPHLTSQRPTLLPPQLLGLILDSLLEILLLLNHELDTTLPP